MGKITSKPILFITGAYVSQQAVYMRKGPLKILY